MDWKLFTIAAGIWIFWGAHFVFRSRISQLAAAGLTSNSSSLINVSRALAILAFLNLIIFSVMYGLRVSWLGAAIILLGGYAASFLYALLTRSVYNTFLDPTVKLGFLALPVLSVLLWIRAPFSS